MARAEQAQFGGGIFRGRRAPSDTVYDALNALINDERELFRRAGSTYKAGSDADGTLLGLWDGHTVAGRRTFFWSATSPYVLDSNDSTIIDLGATVPEPLASGVEIGGLVFFKGGLSGGSDETEVVYAGSRKAQYTTGTLTSTNGSAAVTGSGTSWLANVDAGMILLTSTNNLIGIVKSVESNTALTLTRPTTVNWASTYTATPINRFTVNGNNAGGVLFANPTTAFHAVAGQRLIRTRDNRAYFSVPASHAKFIKTTGISYPAPFETHVDDPAAAVIDYHELLRAALIIGADSIRDTLILFTTEGVWAISNMALDALDGAGNVQHEVAQISQDLILWGEAGIVGWAGALVIPATDDVYVMGLDANPAPLSDGIRPLYREYVEAGYKPGIASVYRAHYHLPILDGSNNVIDSLVCRLDLRDSRGARRPGWTRWANHAAGRAYATRVGATTREPKLLGLAGLRVTDLTGCYDPDPARKADADGTNHSCVVTTNDYATGGRLNTVQKVRAEYELVDAASDNPTVTVEHARGAEGSSFTSASAVRGGAESDGTDFSRWRVGKRADRIRFRISTVGAAARFILRKVGVEVSPSGRQ